MKKLIRIFATSAIVMALTPSAFAHPGGHDEWPRKRVVVPKAQHGGQMFVVDAYDGTLGEVLWSATGLELWFYNSDQQPLAAPATAKLTLTVGREVRKIEAKLDPTKPGRLTVLSALPADQSVTLFIDAMVAGTARSVRVQREAAKAPAQP
ncbi:MAG: hypothetical protein JNM38_11530 [Acidobacteria bacterium]|nr:hypothetical protein [Acidobacteriota bacterium]